MFWKNTECLIHRENVYDALLSEKSSGQNNMFSMIPMLKSSVCVCVCTDRERERLERCTLKIMAITGWGIMDDFYFSSLSFSIFPKFSTINIPYLCNQKKIKYYI